MEDGLACPRVVGSYTIVSANGVKDMNDGLSKGWNRLVVKPSHILKRNAARTHQLVSRSSQAIRLILRASTATRNFSHHARPCIDRLEDILTSNLAVLAKGYGQKRWVYNVPR